MHGSPPLQRYDIFLMEAVNKLGLNHKQLEHINACQMYLQVTMLAEIVDHTGTMILLQVLSLPKGSELMGLHTISTSKLTWPKIHPPTKPSWCLWTTTICNLFAGSPTNTKLHHPFGDWTTDYQVICSWN